LPILVLAFAAGLANCTAGDDGSAGNAAEFCRAQGFSSPSDAFDRCIEDYVETRCAAFGPRDSQAFARCERDIRDRALVRQELRIRGY
jgi:hypothetical protein